MEGQQHIQPMLENETTTQGHPPVLSGFAISILSWLLAGAMALGWYGSRELIVGVVALFVVAVVWLCGQARHRSGP